MHQQSVMIASLSTQPHRRQATQAYPLIVRINRIVCPGLCTRCTHNVRAKSSFSALVFISLCVRTKLASHRPTYTLFNVDKCHEYCRGHRLFGVNGFVYPHSLGLFFCTIVYKFFLCTDGVTLFRTWCANIRRRRFDFVECYFDTTHTCG